MKALLASQFRKTGAVAGGYMGLFGFIADILSPIAPFSNYLFFVSHPTPCLFRLNCNE